jgi:tetratricopeptide (TPR) repeat protein
VEVKSNVKLEFVSSMDKKVDVHNTYEDNGFYFYELLFPIYYKNDTIPMRRKLDIKSYGFDTYTQFLILQSRVPVGLLVINDTKRIADELYEAGKFAEALKEYEKLYSINPNYGYVKDRINQCNEKIKPKEDTSPKLQFIFKGVRKKQNPEAKLYFDNQVIGQGNFNDGFYIKIPDVSGKHELRVIWSGNMPDKKFKINTTIQKTFEFNCEVNGFGGYNFVLMKK